ncbi:hypothetical protein [Paraflavitalea sp. CAU 1676]|uniref:hypothetical protein n=1 Tax=Paraflavitalea sp. CAU 1676 TaxID=3032598 RepID=UPI0023D9920E|nr:hypothetical protein [Paraflavitalea sp. CAU 1676]MDF2187985.1 hypothetical protein [Paraflavitalea sp. CAU 1676]
MASLAVNTFRITGFFKKHWRRILFYCVLLLVVLYLAPRQHDFYLEDDVERFEQEQVTPFLIWFGAIGSVAFFVLTWVWFREIVGAFLGWVGLSVVLCWFLLVFNDQWLAAGLFVNRLFDRGAIEKKFVVGSLAGLEFNRKNFLLHEASTGTSLRDDRVTEVVYRPDLKVKDTVPLELTKGLFGVGYYPGGFKKD